MKGTLVYYYYPHDFYHHFIIKIMGYIFLFLFITYKTMIATLIYIKMLQGHRLVHLSFNL